MDQAVLRRPGMPADAVDGVVPGEVVEPAAPDALAHGSGSPQQWIGSGEPSRLRRVIAGSLEPASCTPMRMRPCDTEAIAVALVAPLSATHPPAPKPVSIDPSAFTRPTTAYEGPVAARTSPATSTLPSGCFAAALMVVFPRLLEGQRATPAVPNEGSRSPGSANELSGRAKAAMNAAASRRAAWRTITLSLLVTSYSRSDQHPEFNKSHARRNVIFRTN